MVGMLSWKNAVDGGFLQEHCKAGTYIRYCLRCALHLAFGSTCLWCALHLAFSQDQCWDALFQCMFLTLDPTAPILAPGVCSICHDPSTLCMRDELVLLDGVGTEMATFGRSLVESHSDRFLGPR